jgi:group I intron endonuclease
MSESIYLIYKHTSPSGKSYIGQTKNYKQRCLRHKSTRSGECRAFYNAIKKYGWDAFSHDILVENLSLDEANKFEQQYIIEYYSMVPGGYNLQTGGLNYIVSDETKRRIGEKSKGRISANKGKTTSAETKDKQSLAKKGIPNPGVAKYQRGRIQSPRDSSKESCKINGTHLSGTRKGNNKINSYKQNGI